MSVWIFSIVAILLSLVKACVPVERIIVSVPLPPTKVSLFPFVDALILKVSFPASPVNVSTPSPPIIV